MQQLVLALQGDSSGSGTPVAAPHPLCLVQGHDITEHMAVFWVAPLSGALLAGLFWSVLTGSPAKKRPQGAKYHPKKNSATAAEAKKDD